MEYFLAIQHHNDRRHIAAQTSCIKIDEKEYSCLKKQCQEYAATNNVNSFSALFVPNFSERMHWTFALLTPTLANLAYKTQAVSFSALFINLIWDFATLPIRVITLLPKLLLMKSEKEQAIPELVANIAYKKINACGEKTLHFLKIDQTQKSSSCDTEKWDLYLSKQEVPYYSNHSSNCLKIYDEDVSVITKWARAISALG